MKLSEELLYQSQAFSSPLQNSLKPEVQHPQGLFSSDLKSKSMCYLSSSSSCCRRKGSVRTSLASLSSSERRCCHLARKLASATQTWCDICHLHQGESLAGGLPEHLCFSDSWKHLMTINSTLCFTATWSLLLQELALRLMLLAIGMQRSMKLCKQIWHSADTSSPRSGC